MRVVDFGYIHIHGCLRDCALYCGKYKERDQCPICKESLSRQDKKGDEVPRNDVPQSTSKLSLGCFCNLLYLYISLHIMQYNS